MRYAMRSAMRSRSILRLVALTAVVLLLGAIWFLVNSSPGRASGVETGFEDYLANPDTHAETNAMQLITQGRQIFRYDTYGDEAFWGDTLQLHQAIQGEKFGGVGPGVSPKTALALGLKVDMNALPATLVQQLKAGKVNLDDPATTLALIKLNAVVGVKGFFNPNGSLKSIGLSCAVCHSTVNDAFAPGIGVRLDGWANHDLNVGAIAAAAPNLQPVADLLGVDVDTLKKVLNSWGPGKFDAEVFLDGKAFRPDGGAAATLNPNAFGLVGVNEHTWTGGWGTVTYWNAFVANLELHGKGNFFDPRLDDASKYPVAAKAGLGHVQTPPDQDQVTSKLGALQFYQLSLPAPQPPASAFNAAAAKRGQQVFNSKAKCATCHVPPLYTEPGWNLHKAEDIGIDNFQADRAPDNRYKTQTLRGLWIRELGVFMNPENKGRFFHDGRFATLRDVVNHYNTFLNLGLTEEESNDLIEFLKSL